MLLENEEGGRPGVIAGPSAFAAGTVLKETYRIVRPLAEGGCGEVYLAAHTRLPGTFAVKVLNSSLVRDPEALARFRQEAEITSTLRHPHIVQVVDFNVADGGVPYLVMEMLEGRPLAQLVRGGAPVEPHRAANIIEQIAQALHAAHESGVVHRDLKPDNVMLLATGAAEDFVKVLDFGISQASWRTRLTQSDRVSGTPQYMAPEQACGFRERIDHRTDQFSLAAIAYALLTGREPFSGDDPIAVLYQVVHRVPPAPSEINRALEDAVSDVIVRGLSKTPDDRYPDVLDFAAALRDAVQAAPVIPSEDERDAPPVRVAAPDVAAASVSGDDTSIAAVGPSYEVLPPGLETKRLIRRMRWRTRTPRRIVLVTLVAALAALAWLHPSTIAPTRVAWERIEHGTQGLLGRATTFLSRVR